MTKVFTHLKNSLVRRLAIHTLNHALSMNDCTDDNARSVDIRLLKLLKFDNKHHNDLPLNNKQAHYLITLGKSPSHPALRTAELIFRRYVTLFKRSYHIDVYREDHDLNEFAYHYLTCLDIDIAPIPNDEKFELTLLENM